MAAPVSKRAAVGWRVRVFWEGDDEWFEGVVTRYDPESGYYVAYDDGEEQWEAEDTSLIEFLYATSKSTAVDTTTSLILAAEARIDDRHDDDNAQGDDDECEENRQKMDKWSSQPPPSTAGYDDVDTLEQEEYDDDHDHETEDESDNRQKTPSTPEDDINASDDDQRDDERHTKRQQKVRGHPPTRDPTKYVKSGVFFRDPETLKETKASLAKEKQQLQQQYELLTSQLAQKELLSQSLKHDLHGLKAQVTVASLKSNTSSSKMPRTAREWAERVVAQKTEKRAKRQELSSLHQELTKKQALLQQMDKQKQQLELKLARVPRRELCSLVDVQMEIAQVLTEKRELETQLTKSLAADWAQSKSRTTYPMTLAPTTSQDQRDTKTELETELRQLEKTLLRAQDERDEWKLSYEKEHARIAPLRTRITCLQSELHTYERSQVLLRSLFMRLDRTGSGNISVDAALDALAQLAPRNGDGTSHRKDEIKAKMVQTATGSLDYPAFAQSFQQVFN